MEPPDFYVTGIAASQFVYGADSLGLDSRQAMARAGLSEASIKPTARVAEPVYEKLLLELIVASHNDSLGADIGGQLMPPLYGVLMSLAMSARTVGDAFQELARYQALASGNCGGIEYHYGNDGATLTIVMAHQNPVIRRHVIECVFNQFAGFIQLLSGRQDLSPSAASVAHAPASRQSQRRFESALGCPVNWQHSSNQLHLSDPVHEFPILGHGEETLMMARQLADKQLAALNEHASSINQIRLHALELIREATPRREAVADRMSISTRTLDRRLSEAGLTWQALVDGIRAQLAVEYLNDASLTIADIAHRLGFSEIRSFQRRFRLWTGLTPSAYRQQSGPAEG